MRTHLFPALLLALFALAGSGEPLDPLMGDWQGALTTAAGEKPIFAQVICWGREGYQANLLETLEQRVAPVAVLRGPGDGATVTFGEQAKIADGVFSGTLEGEHAGKFALKHVVRLSPTLGEKPPAGAEVLFDGSGFEQLAGDGSRAWILNLAQLVGGANRAAYLRCRLSVPAAVPAVLEVGSDDGVKAWLNGKLVHANPAFRPLREWEDKAGIDLQAGENVLLLKVIQGQGDWSACARVRGRDGKDLEGLKADPAPVLPEGVDAAVMYGESRGTILAWELAGPFMAEGKDAAAIADQAFPPEVAGDTTTQWKAINDHPKPAPTWKLVDDAMEVTPGAGFMHSRQSYRNFHMHLEFRSPYMPDARGQGRGNSGVYIQSRWEIQVLDSYGLKGEDNECGGMYHIAAPLVNACAPPGQWQTYDVDFTAAKFDVETNKVLPAEVTVRHNGLLVQDRTKLAWEGGAQPGFVSTGPISLQDHGNTVQYRNVWVLPK